MVSDKAQTCPHCGCTISSQEVVDYNSESQDYDIIDEEVGTKGSKLWIYALVGIAALALAIGGYYLMNSRSDVDGVGDTQDVENAFVSDGKYRLVLYDDNTGDFIAPNGGRVCGFEIRDRNEPLSFNLKKTITILGHNTDRVFVSGEYFFADYSDYLQLQYQDRELMYAPVTKQERDGVTVFMIDFAEGQIENLVPEVHQIDFPENEYTMLFYNDKSGALYGPGGEHICGLTDSYTDGKYRLSKTVDLLGVSTNELNVYNNKLYKSAYDVIDEKYAHAGDVSKCIADVSVIDEGNVIIYHFSTTAKKPETLTEDGESVFKSSSMASSGSTSEPLSGALSTSSDIDRWLTGRWVNSTIDPSELDIYNEVFTFSNGYYSFACGTERTFHSVGGSYRYHVEGDIIYTEKNAPLLRIDRLRKQLIKVDDSEKVYSKY